MTPKKIWLSSPHMGGAELSFVQDAFNSNWIAPLGPLVDGFEDDLARCIGVSHAAVLSSGTAALHIALILLDTQPGDYVICQSKTFAASANPITYLGATPIFIDSEPQTWNMDPNALEDALRVFSTRHKRPKAIIPVHLYGMPANMNEIGAIADRYGVPVIEDAAEAIGSTYFDKPCGALGLLGVLSFNGNKIITTSGGGALVSNDSLLIQKARFLASQSRDPAPHYQHSQVGYNYRLSNILAGIGRGQMQVLPDRLRARRANFERYRAFFEKWNADGFHIRFQEEQEGMYSNRWLSCILIDARSNHGLHRERIRLQLEAHHIEARPLWKPLHLQPVFSGVPYFGGGTAEQLFEDGLCLPSGSNLSESDWTRIEIALESCRENITDV